MLFNRILIHYGEIVLKGRNRPRFQKRLLDNIRRRLESVGLDWPVWREHHQVFVDVPDGGGQSVPEALDAVADVAGVVWFAPCCRVDAPDGEDHVPLESLAGPLLAMAEERASSQATFAVRVTRADKAYPLRSSEIERELGGRVRQQTPWARVDLTAPDHLFQIIITRGQASVYRDRREGPGGMPVGSAGRVTALLSGGLDSPVASYLAARRGCQVDFVHFTANRMQLAQARRYKVARLAQQLSRVSLKSRLYLLPYLHFDTAMLQKDTREAGLVLFRRFMMRVTERIAADRGAQAVVTGDNLGQVASQTLENIVTTTRSVATPILRPLITYDKREIMDVARRIGTYDLSIEPYKDCCALVDRNSRTTSRHDSMTRMEDEAFTDYDQLINDTLADAVVLDYECGRERGSG